MDTDTDSRSGDQLEDTEWEPEMSIEQTKEVVSETDWLKTYSYPAGRLRSLE